jgi:hypothetical protein
MRVAAMISLVTALLVVAQEPAPAAAPPAQPAKPYKLNMRVVEEITLPDLDGKDHSLLAESEGKALVLVFWSYRDPVSRLYAPRLAELQAARLEKAAVYLVDSNYDELAGAGDPLARMREVVEAEKVTLPILIDRENKLADDFAAVANAQVFLLDANKFLRYHGGIDDDPRGERSAAGREVQKWLEPALDAVIEGKRPKEPWTRPAGRPIKRVPGAKSGPTVPGPGKKPGS